MQLHHERELGGSRILVVAMALVGVFSLTGCQAIREALGLIPPVAPTGLEAVNNGDGSILVTWGETPDADGYVLESSQVEGSDFVEMYTGPDASYYDNDIALGLEKFYRVAATNEHGVSPYSDVAAGVIPAAPPPAGP